MLKGKIGGLFGQTGQVLSEGNTYNFNISVVDGRITNGNEVEFELDGSTVKVIYGLDSKKPVIPAPVKPTPVPVENVVKNKESKTISNLVDNRDLLTEEK